MCFVYCGENDVCKSRLTNGQLGIANRTNQVDDLLIDFDGVLVADREKARTVNTNGERH